LTNLALECGGVAAQFKAFIDRASEVWFAQKWKDNQVQLLYLAINASQHSMIWVNPGEMPSYYLGKSDGVNRLGSFLGVMGQSQMDMSGKEAVLDSGDSVSGAARSASAAAFALGVSPWEKRRSPHC
jgi:NAD(P)H dehydrogenase (quinone)